MVPLKELNKMFWGVTLDGGKRYFQIVKKSFHISMASLQIEPKATKGEKGDFHKTVSVMIQHDTSEFMLCTLDHVKKYQQFLDLNFTEGEEITFFLNGEGVVHLTGYILEDLDSSHLGRDGDCYSFDGSSDDDDDEDFEMDDEDEEEESTDEDIPKLKAIKSGDQDSEESDDEDSKPKVSKRKISESNIKQQKKQKFNPFESDEDDSEDESEDDMEFDSDDYNFMDDESEEESEEEESKKEEIKFKKSVKKNEIKKTPQKPEISKTPSSQKPENIKTPVNKQEPSSESAKKSKKKKKNKGKETPNTPNTSRLSSENTPKISTEQQKTPTSSKIFGTPKTGGHQQQTSGSTKKSEKKKNKHKQLQENTPNTSRLSSENTPKFSTEQQKTPTSSKIFGTPKTDGGHQQQTSGSTKKSEKKKDKQLQENGDTPQSSAKKEKKVRAGGTMIEDTKLGSGPEAKPGKMVHVFYKGRLENGKQFDACEAGKPFAFRLGKGEVIKGWDTGLIGMKVGGKRTVKVPASQGYGTKRAGSIPPNSTLFFDIELKAIT